MIFIPLPIPYPVYGNVTDYLGATLSGITVTAQGPSLSTTGNTNNSGNYLINLQSICSNGEQVTVSITYDAGASSVFTVDITGAAERVDLQALHRKLSNRYNYDLAIYYNSLTGNDFVDCKASRWDVQNYNVIIETWLKESDYKNIRDNTKPGAVGELYNILGKPKYYDKTWDGGNTLRLLPTPSSNLMNNSNLKKMRTETLIYVKNITTHIYEGNAGWVGVKIEGLVSGSSNL